MLARYLSYSNQTKTFSLRQVQNKYPVDLLYLIFHAGNASKNQDQTGTHLLERAEGIKIIVIYS